MDWNHWVTNALIVIISEVIITPIITMIVKRVVTKRLDEFDLKRETARAERNERLERDQLWQDSMTAGMRSMLRSALITEHRRCVKNGGCSTSTREYVSRIATAYKGVGGNDIGDGLYAEIMSLPTINEE